MQPSGYPLIAAAVLCLALAGPGLAQETTTPSTAAETPEAAAETASPDVPDARDAVSETPSDSSTNGTTDDVPEGTTLETPAEAPSDAEASEAAGSTPAATDLSEPASDASAAPGTGEVEAGAPAESELTEVTRDTFDDWEVRCLPASDECFLYQLALDSDGNPVAEFSLLKLPTSGEATAGATVVTPLGTLLTSGVVLQLDGGAERQYPFGWCSQVGCFARFGLDDETINVMKRGQTGQLTLVSVADPDAPISVPLSLTGFTRAYDSLELPN